MLIHQIIDESPARKEATGRKKETVKKKKKVKGRKLKDSNLENLIYYHPRRFGIPSGRYDGRLSYREKRANNFLKRKSSKKTAAMSVDFCMRAYIVVSDRHNIP